MTVTVGDRFRFVHIPKTAGTSITRWIRDNPTDRWDTSAEFEHRHSHESVSEALKTGSVDFTVSTVRNPYDRLVSIFINIRRLKQYSYSNNFNEWLLGLRDGKKFLLNHHFFRLGFTQSAYLDGPIDYLMRFESLEEDFKQVQEYFKVSKKLPHANPGRRNKDYRVYYCYDSKKIASKLIEEDLENFKYTF